MKRKQRTKNTKRCWIVYVRCTNWQFAWLD